RASVAQYELHLTRKRTKRILQKVKADGGAVNQHAGYGWKLVTVVAKGKRQRRRVPDEEEREQIAEIVRLHEREGKTLEQVYLHFVRRGERTRAGKRWSYDRVKRAYAAAKGLGMGSHGTRGTAVGGST